MIVSIRDEQKSTIFDKNLLRRRAKRLLKLIDKENGELSILLTDDPGIHEINVNYRNVDRPTDVIAFAMQEGEGAGINPDILGDIVISLETAERQANEQNHSLKDEVIHLLIHGLLHLIGYDHVNDKIQEEKMGEEHYRLFSILTGVVKTSADIIKL